MNILDFDTNLYEKILNCKDFSELVKTTACLADTLICWQKILNDLLQNLDSDNIAEIDFSKVKIINMERNDENENSSSYI